MKINIQFYFLSFLLSPLSFLSCNHANLGRNNMHEPDEQNTACSSNTSPSQDSPQSILEHMNQCINEFKEHIQSCVHQLIKLNPSNHTDDVVRQHEQVVRSLYDVFSSDHTKLPFIYHRGAQADLDTYIASYNTILTLIKDHFQQPYSNAALVNNAQRMKNLHDKLFDSLKEQIIDTITDLFMHQLSAPVEMEEALKKTVKEAKKFIEHIIASRFEINTKCFKQHINMLKDYMKTSKLLKGTVAPNETAIYQCLKNYFHRLKATYYDPIQTHGDALLQSIENNIKPLATNDLNLIPLENSVNRLVYTVCIYSAMRLLLYFGLLHRSMTLARTNLKTPHTTPKAVPYSVTKSYADQTIVITYLADVYITIINLGIADCSLSATYTNLIESCANMTKLSLEATQPCK